MLEYHIHLTIDPGHEGVLVRDDAGLPCGAGGRRNLRRRPGDRRLDRVRCPARHGVGRRFRPLPGGQADLSLVVPRTRVLPLWAHGLHDPGVG